MTPAAQRWLTWAVASALGLVMAFGLHQIAFFQTIEAKSYDWRVKNLREQAPKASSAIVLVDEATLAFFKETDGIRWPFPRDVYCPVLQYLKSGGAAAVAFDIQFSEPDEFDGPFGECIREAGNVVLGIQCRSDKKAADLPLPGTVAVKGDLGQPPCRPLPPMPELAKAARALAAIDMEPDPDGVLRHATVVRPWGGGAFGSLGAAAHFVASKVREVERLGPRELRIDEARVPTSEDGRMLVRWRRGPGEGGQSAYPTYSFKQIYANAMLQLDGQKPPLPPSTFKDRVVFMATSAAGTYEVRVTPISEVDFGVHLHVASYEALRSGDHSRDAHGGLDLLLLVLFTLLVGGATTLLKKFTEQVGMALVLVAAYLGAAAYAYDQHGLWIDAVVPTIAMLTAFVSGSIGNYLTEGRARKELRSAFQHYLAPEVVTELVSDPSKLQLGGERRDITAFFSDIAGFTTFSEAMTPSELVAFLNEYLTELTVIITDEGGTIDKYEGDAIIAMFGAPVAHADHAARACRAAMRCHQRLDELAAEWTERGLPPCTTRIGLNSGPAVVGNMGASFRFDYTMIGDTVNLAARLEGTNKVYGTRLLVGVGTWERAKDAIAMREIDLVKVKGKTFGVAVYSPEAVVGQESEAQQALAERYAEALALYRSGDFEAAAGIWQGLADDPASQTMATRAHALAADPPDDWDGVYTMTTK